MLTPPGWKLIDMGGGSTSLYLPIPDSMMEWGITQVGAPIAPTSSDEPCVLTLWQMHDALIQWDCSCLAEATQIAEGART